MRCEKCQFECDSEDAFCRKCGAAVAHEGSFAEVSATPVQTIEVETVSDSTPAEVSPAFSLEITRTEVSMPVVAEKKPGLLSKVAGAISSDTGRKVIKGAALVAVGVGIELAAQAVNRSQQPGQQLARRNGNGNAPANYRRGMLVAQVIRRSASGHESITNFFAPPEGTTVTETFVYDHVTVKRTTKW